MTNYRLLNDDEVIEDGDEFYSHSEREWLGTLDDGSKHDPQKCLRRRPISVGTWIPTSERLPDPLPKRRVLIQEHNGERYSGDAYSVTTKHHIAWQELPELYVAPEPKRRKGHCVPGFAPFDWIEVLPGDPDLDVVLNVLEEMHEPDAEWNRLKMIKALKRIEESRSK